MFGLWGLVGREMADRFIEFIKRKGILFVAPITISILLLISYWASGIYPFGDRTIAYYDMAQTYVPVYTHVWDVLHGRQSIFFSWNLGMGAPMADIASNFLAFPTNIFFLFVGRNKILESMSVFLLIKIMISAFTMSFYSYKRVNDKALIIISGLLYSACGYTIQYYTNIMFLDTVMVFPLLVLFLEDLILEGKYRNYILLLILVMLTNIQLVYMVLLYVILKSWILLKGLDTDIIGERILCLGCATLTSILISGVFLIPDLFQMLQSSRLERNVDNGYFDIIRSMTSEFQQQKNLMLYCGEVGIAATLVVILNGKHCIKRYYRQMILMLILLLPIVFDNINRMWHGGSYVHFPMRFGFILAFELICVGMTVLEDCTLKQFKNMRHIYLLAIAITPLVIIMLWFYDIRFKQYGIRDLDTYTGYGFVFIALVLFWSLVVLDRKRNRALLDVLCILVCVVQTFCGMYGFVGPKDSYSMECDASYIYKIAEVHDNIKENIFNTQGRIKDRNVALNVNYGTVLGKQALGGWVNGINSVTQDAMSRLGYSTNYTRVLDNGGTILSDALLGVRYVYSEDKLDDKIYDNLGGNFYQCKYVLPFANIIDNKLSYDSDGFDYQNELFEGLTGYKKLINIVDTSKILIDSTVKDGINVFATEIIVDEPTILYLRGKQYKTDAYCFLLNGKELILPYLSDVNNKEYMTYFVNGIIELGQFANEKVELRIATTDADLNNLEIGMLSVPTFNKGLKRISSNIQYINYEYNGMEICIDSEDGGDLFLPIAYSDGWTARIDEKRADAGRSLINAFLGVSLPKGKHTLKLKYKPPGINIGIAMTIGGLMLLILNHYGYIKKMYCGKFSKRAISYLYYAAVYMILFVMYVIPITVGLFYYILSVGM